VLLLLTHINSPGARFAYGVVMKPTEILMAEHRVIEQVLNCLEKMTKKAAAGAPIDRHDAQDAVDFFRMFADKCHHGKEEAQLFPAMEAHGFPREGGPTGVMMKEHDLGRQHVRGIAAAIDGAASGDPKAQSQFVEHASGFLNLLRQHIDKEDHCLFTMADQALSETDQKNLLTAFENVERNEMGAGTHEKYLGIANRLADRYGVPRATESATEHSHNCCGHH
jgi:hemerythrin-like domain-containing protein